MIDQTPIVTTMRPRSKLRPLHLMLVFLVGLLLGWLVLGWVVWPVAWIDAVPANLQAEDQRQFVILVAEEYAQSGDAARARQRLVSWDEASLATLLAVMEQEAVNEATVMALANLRQALAVPATELTFWDTILEQKLVVISAVLGGLVLLTAVALTLYPSIRRNQKRRARQRQLEAEEEALLQAARAAQLAEAAAPTEPETAVASPANQPAAQLPAVETAVPTQAQPAQPAPAEQPARPEQQQATAPADEAQNGQKQSQAAEAAKPNEAQPAAKPGEQPAAPANPPQPAAPAPTPRPLLTEEEEEEASNSLQDILTSVFEDDDESAHFESLLKGLDDIYIMKLIKDVDHVAQQLRDRRPKGKTAVSAPVRSRA